jgi:hypothetical protein
MTKKFFNTALGLSMLRDGDVNIRTFALEEAIEWFDSNFTNAANPNHSNSLQALTQKTGVNLTEAEGGRILLESGDECLVAQISNIPRETREFTDEEIAAATFIFRLITVI